MTHIELVVFAAMAFAAARAARLHDADERGLALADVDALIHGPLWRGVRRAGAAAESFHRMWRRGEAGTAARLSGWVSAWLADADRPARRLLPDAAWLLAAVAGILVLIFIFAR